MSDSVTIQKAPGIIRTYEFTWTDAANDSISSSTWTDEEGVTIDDDDFTNTTTIVTLSGGVEGTNGRLKNNVTYTSGQTDYRWVTVEVSELSAFTDAQLATIAEITQEHLTTIEVLAVNLSAAQVSLIQSDIITWNDNRNDVDFQFNGDGVSLVGQRLLNEIRERVRKQLGLPLYSLEVYEGSVSIHVRAVF